MGQYNRIEVFQLLMWNGHIGYFCLGVHEKGKEDDFIGVSPSWPECLVEEFPPSYYEEKWWRSQSKLHHLKIQPMTYFLQAGLTYHQIMLSYHKWTYWESNPFVSGGAIRNTVRNTVSFTRVKNDPIRLTIKISTTANGTSRETIQFYKEAPRL